MLGLALLLLTACGSNLKAPELQSLYESVAQNHDRFRNPVVVIPGILGTRLVDASSGDVVWGAFGSGAIDPGSPRGMRKFALPMAEGADLAELVDGVRTDGVLETLEVRIAGLPLELQAYMQILEVLGAGGYRDETFRPRIVDYGDGHFTCFQFAYDWRRDNVENARRLYHFLEEKRAYVAAERLRLWGDTEPVKFDVIAHSMGGLLLRYMLRFGDRDLPEDPTDLEPTWAGAELVDRAVLVAPPNAGAIGPFEQLLHGRRFGKVVRYRAPLLDTFPAAYQLMPRQRHGLVTGTDGQALDLLDPRVWIDNGWGLANPDHDEVLAHLMPGVDDPTDRRRIALDHLHKVLDRAKRFQRILDHPAAPPPGTELILYAGDSEKTPRAARYDPEAKRLRITEFGLGDGRVLRSSALMDERVGQPWIPELQSPVHWSQVSFVFRDHLGITKDPSFIDNMLYLLLEAPRNSPQQLEAVASPD